MKLIIFISILSSLLFVGCTAKKFNDNVDSITNDISKVFEEGKDKSSN